VRDRLTAILLLLATLIAPLAHAAAATRPSVQPACCGGECDCGDTCPCAGDGSRSVPRQDAPAAPSSSRDVRPLFLHLPLASATVLLEPLDPTGVSTVLCAPTTACDSGRALLARVSRWTT